MSSPGWYPDPDPNAPPNRLRFWDGTTWTEQVSSPEGAPAPQPPPAPLLSKDPGGDPGPHGQDPGPRAGSGPAGPGEHPAPGYVGPPGHVGPPGQTGVPGYGPPAYPVPHPTHLPDGTALASVWKRLGAFLIDTLVVSAISVAVAAVVFGIPLLIGGGIDSARSGSASGAGFMVGFLIGWLLFFVAMVAVYVWYYVVRVRQTGATFGKQWLGMQIRDWYRPGQLTWAQILTRTLLVDLADSVTGNLFGLIDALWCLWDPHRQTLHDKMAGTVVVDHSLPRAPAGSGERELAAAVAPQQGWIAQGPEPASPPGYPHLS